MKQSITVSVPGKIHLLGEHTVVYGKPALLSAIDKRCYVTVSHTSEHVVTVKSKNYGISKSMSLDELFLNVSYARGKWREFIETKDISLLTSLGSNVLEYSFLAVGESLLPYKNNLNGGFTIDIESEIPEGSGCGSSAAIAVGIAGATQHLFDGRLDREKLFETAVRIEEFKHGTPSGGDVATVLRGGFIWFEKKDDKKTITPLDISLSGATAENFYLIDTGKPKESTGEMIASVRELKEKRPEFIDEIFNDQTQLVRQLVEAIKKNDSTSIIYIIEVGERNLEKLGVVSPFVRALIGEVEKQGGAAKISGGGGKKKGTGMLVVYSQKHKELEELCKSKKLIYFQTKLGAEGLRIEK